MACRSVVDVFVARHAHRRRAFLLPTLLRRLRVPVIFFPLLFLVLVLLVIIVRSVVSAIAVISSVERN
jgi:hypothetical protein